MTAPSGEGPMLLLRQSARDLASALPHAFAFVVVGVAAAFAGEIVG